MIRLITIGLLIVLAYFLIRYRTSEKVQKGVVMTLGAVFVIYIVSVVVAELFR
ncbi:hypothetical protein [Vibrio fluvialis]|uniref:hypothetical protein n=1 Tax=Vibrio fluvialis TaxID=676 RepID=UPI0012AE7892|nr:hypothetical protein [Vibrio fluvialis]EKO3389238.1 hypothetical protein [Vibrio fluvialis]EKO3405017.1 hypothetical protein [Vibrio fluvialis]MBY7902048.1 hypothetical protein [Vibrio fluvialis]MBY7941079.1 hypothetical protein [Vibrio fluvialis]MBY8167466.1 hypothetical protein [Vibrio fluvialis]